MSAASAIDRLVGQLHASRSEVVPRALEFYLYRLACEQIPLTDAELALADDPDAWVATPE